MKSKNFIIIIIGQIISLFGSAIQRFSLSLYLLEVTGSAGTFANILAFSMLPYVICAPIAGVLADRINRKKIMVYLDFISSGIIGGYAFLLLTGKDSTALIAVVMFLLSVTYTLYAPSVSAVLPQVVSEDNLMRANGVVSQVSSLANFLGPILAGILYGVFGITFIVIINGISFFLSAILELFLDVSDIAKKNKYRFSYWNSVKEMGQTFQYLKKEKKVVLATIGSYGLSNISFSPAFTIVAPFVINVSLAMPSSVYGAMEGFIVLGMILGGLMITMKPKYFSMKRLHHTLIPMVPCFILMAVMTLFIEHKWLVVVIFALCGMITFFSLGISNVISLSYIQQVIAQDKLGKVSAFSTAVATISVAPGQLLYGQLLERGMSLGAILLLTAILNFSVLLFVRWNVKRI